MPQKQAGLQQGSLLQRNREKKLEIVEGAVQDVERCKLGVLFFDRLP